MNFILDTITGGAATLGLLAKTVDIDTLPTGSIEELVNYLISLFGGILAAIVLNFLRKKFPSLFTKIKEKQAAKDKAKSN
jgi:hypothetical protein